MRFVPLLLGLLWAASAAAQADLVLHHARIYTMNPAQPMAEALAVRDGRLVMVGSDAAVRAAYPDAPAFDANGQTVVPGLIDAHAHLMGLGLARLQVDLVGTPSKQEVLARLQAFAQTLPPGAWLTGRGWDQNDWPEKAFPTRHDLDEVFPDRPVWLDRVDGHAAWGNTAALRAFGLERLQGLPDPTGGTIVRDGQGVPTGVFIDNAAALIEALRPPPTSADLDRALQLALAETRRYGLTGVHDAGVDQATLDRYRHAIDQGRFDLRVYAMVGGRGPTFDHFCQNPIPDYGGKLTLRAVKFYIDGALGSRGAALLEPYTDDPHNQGLLFAPPDSFAASVRRARACGYQVNTHAIGDRGNRVVLDAYQQAGLTPDERPRIEHAQVVAPDDLPRFRTLGVIAAMQPTHATSDMYWAEDRLGPDRVRGAYAWQRFLQQGTVLAFGSDFPVEHANPLLGFYAAVTRQDAQGWPEGGWQADQRLRREEALYAFTMGAAYAAFMEDRVGSLEPGKYADFVLLSRDLMTIPAPDILQTEVAGTWLGGVRIYGQ
jgi:predicted amidohydrolase YtcJ